MQWSILLSLFYFFHTLSLKLSQVDKKNCTELGTTWHYWAPLGFTWLHMAPLGKTEAPFGTTWLHLAQRGTAVAHLLIWSASASDIDTISIHSLMDSVVISAV